MLDFFVEISLGKAQRAFLKFTIIEQPCFKLDKYNIKPDQLFRLWE